MTIANKLGSTFEKLKDQVKIKPIKLTIGEASFTLRVRIPLKKEMEQITESITNPDPVRIEDTFAKLAQPIKETIANAGEGFLDSLNENNEKIKITENDVIMDGTSIRQVALFTAMWETKVEQYFHLLESETGEPVNESYEQIVEELPEQVIKQIVEEIESAVRPDYKNTKKN